MPRRKRQSILLLATSLFLSYSPRIVLRSLSGKGRAMRWFSTPRLLVPAVLTVALVQAGNADAACCYFSAQNADILQPAQKVFITWDPAKQQESFTVQPK